MESMQHELPNTVTLWRACGWTENHNPEHVMRGYDMLNRAINELSRHTTVYCVSYSHLIIPSDFVLRLFATVVYRSTAPDLFEPESLDETEPSTNWIEKRGKAMPKHETRRILTFSTIRAWYGDTSSDAESPKKMYSKLNYAVNDFAQKVTIHSVSYDHIIFTVNGTTQPNSICLSASVTYTGPSAFEIWEKKNPYGIDTIEAHTTVIDVS
jgi:hypothetical protein